MSLPKGFYLGGIRTVEDLRQRCYVDDITGCWHWRMALDDGFPTVHFVTPDTGRHAKMRGRRATLYLARGKDLPRGHGAFAKLCCESKDCVNPDHARSGDRKAHGEYLQRSGIVKGLPGKIAAAKARWMGRRKLSAEAVAEIRRGGMSDYRFAEKFGVSQFAVWSARVGRSHKEVPGAGSVFNWRPQA